MTLKELGFNEIDHEALAKTETPYKVYAELLDETAQRQFEDVLNEPYVTRGALMPDAHAEYIISLLGICKWLPNIKYTKKYQIFVKTYIS